MTDSRASVSTWGFSGYLNVFPKEKAITESRVPQWVKDAAKELSENYLVEHLYAETFRTEVEQAILRHLPKPEPSVAGCGQARLEGKEDSQS